MADEKLMSIDEFNNLVTKWAMKIRSQSRGTLARTKGKGRLKISLAQFVDKLSSADPAYKVKFDFERYGVFRAYGVGRGYVRINGAVVRGYRVRSESEIKKRTWGIEAAYMRKNGYADRDINRAKKAVRDASNVERTSLDWIDLHIQQNIQDLADLVQDFYGDDALKEMMKNIDKIKIKKK